jgi:hypothetical protein
VQGVRTVVELASQPRLRPRRPVVLSSASVKRGSRCVRSALGGSSPGLDPARNASRTDALNCSSRGYHEAAGMYMTLPQLCWVLRRGDGVDHVTVPPDEAAGPDIGNPAEGLHEQGMPSAAGGEHPVNPGHVQRRRYPHCRDAAHPCEVLIMYHDRLPLPAQACSRLIWLSGVRIWVSSL